MIRAYLKQQRLGIIVGTILLITVTFILTMYELPLAGLTYSLALTTITWVLYLVYKGYHYVRKCQLLSQVSTSLEHLNVGEDLIDVKYYTLLKSLYDEKYELLSQMDAKQTELSDYYTLWTHQIKTPIAAMRLLLQASAAPSEQHQELFKIEQYVEMALTFLRLESISADLDFREYSLDDMVKQAVKKYAPFFIQKNIALKLDELGRNILTDQKWLQFALEQLISNAIKYTNAGSVAIYMEADTLVIEDTGIGIGEEDLPRIFERGFTGYNGRMDKKSTGIGLFLCHQIFEKLAHTMTFTSEVGKGTKVYLDLSR